MRPLKLFLFGGLATVLTVGAAATTSSPWDGVPSKDHVRINPLKGKPDLLAGGAALFKDHCAQCHGRDAEGRAPDKPSLRSERIRMATDGDLEWFLRQGDLRGGMPSWSNLPQGQRWQLVLYLRSLDDAK